MKIAKAMFWLAGLALILGGMYWLAVEHKGSSADAGDEDQEAPVPVEVAKIEKKTLAEPRVAYGSVVAQPARVQTISAAFESMVRRVLVAPGQSIKKGDALAEIEPSAVAQLTLRQAMNAAEAAERDLEQTRSRFAMKLATNQDLGTSEKEANDAQLQLQSLQQTGLGMSDTIRAPMDGIVAKVDVQNGELAPSGTALVETVAADDIEVKLGVQEGDLGSLKEGSPVEIESEQSGTPATGAVRLVTHRIDTDTRLIDVYVSLPQGSGLLLDDYVKGTFKRVADGALVVPTAAVESDEDGYCVFTVADGIAARHGVEPGLEADDQVAITGSGLAEGETVATTGSHELSDGDKVEEAGKDAEK